MKLILHILAKDARRLRWQIPVVVAVMVAMRFASTFNFVWLWFPWYLVARVIHEDPLVGDRQFWVTRPCSWKNLLAAKVLFVAAFVVVPGLIADCAALLAAGLGPTSYLPGLILKAITDSVLFFLPVAALAAVTRGFAQLAFAGLALIMPVIGLAYTQLYQRWPAQEWTRESVMAAILLSGTLIVLFRQFKLRRTASARGLLVAAVGLAMVAYVALPWDLAVALQYRKDDSKNKSPLRITFDPKSSQRGSSSWPGMVTVYFPFVIDGLPEDTEISWDAAKLQIQSSDGLSWRSAWSSLISRSPAAHGLAMVGVPVPEHVYRQVKYSRAEIRLSFAITLFKNDGATRMTLQPNARLSIPDFGVCTSSEGSLRCVSALRLPRCRLEAGFDPSTACVSKSAAVPSDWNGAQLLYGAESSFSSSPFPADFGGSAIVLSFYRDLATQFVAGSKIGRAELCSGTELTFVTQRPVDHIVRDVEIHDVRLMDYNPIDPNYGRNNIR
ncbi:MAG: hypothetical protein ACREDR_05755 [Blastocatellia bacterium]